MSPDKYTVEERILDVGNGHQLYTQLWGNKNAKHIIIFLHGGPGGCTNDKHKTLFNPATQLVVFFDQRGCGKSTPHGSLVANDTDHLVEDINKVAEAFGFKTFTLTGGSWGSCLALVYGIRYPKRVERMVLRGIFTGRKSEIDFIDKGAFRATFPDIWERFVKSVPAKYREDPGKFHVNRMLGKDLVVAKKSAYAYDLLENSLSFLDDREEPEKFEDFDPAPITIECSYLVKNCYLPEGYVIKNAAKLTMPIKIVQGRYDMVCPPTTAYELAQKLPNANLTFTIAGHSGNDRANWEVTKALLSQG